MYRLVMRKIRVNFVKVTARINEVVHDVMKDIVEDYNVSFSEVVRLSVDRYLGKYMGTIQYIDKSQGKEIIPKYTQLEYECREYGMGIMGGLGVVVFRKKRKN